MTVYLSELVHCIDEDAGPVPWVEPDSVVGFERRAEFERAKTSWFRLDPGLDLSASPVELIPDYIDHCLSRAAFYDAPPISGERLLDALIWLVRSLGSSYAVGTLAVWRGLVQEVPTQVALEKVLAAITQEPEPFVRDILRSLLWDYFDVGGLWPDWQARLRGVVDPSVIDSIEALGQNGYETIDNEDARRFADGRPRL